MTATLQIQLFGGLRVALDGVPVKSFYANKAPALLAYLAVTRRAPSRDALAALLWGEMSDADAKTNLRQCLANLRKLIEPYLIITRDEVEFNLDALYVLDVEQFELQLGADCLEAVALYKGDFLDGVFDPWREETRRELMVMLARSGQRSVTLQQYQVCKRALAQEMGVEPSAETTALYERIRAAGESPRHNLPAQVTALVERALELAAFVLHHASSEQATKDKAKQLVCALTSRLSAALAEAAQKRGSDRDLREVVTELENLV